MKIDIEIPDGIIEEGRAIHIMAGNERIAYKLPWEDFWRIKYSKCSMCGLCCEKLKCEYLDKNTKYCKAPLDRPFVCCVTEPRTIKSCTSLYQICKEF